MASTAASDQIVVVRRRHPAATVAKWLGIGLLAIVALIAAFLLWLNTDPGRRFLVNQINAFETVIRPQGPCRPDRRLGIRRADLARRLARRSARASSSGRRPPSSTIGRSPISAIISTSGRSKSPRRGCSRLPELRAGDPNAPLLPDIDIDVGRLRIDRLLIDPAVTGRRHLLSLDSRIRIADGRAEVSLDAATIRAPGFAGGDRIRLVLDAVPEANRLDLGLFVSGPGDGFVAGLARHRPADRGAARRPRLLGELARPGPGAARRPGLRRPRRHRPRRHLHLAGADPARSAAHRPGAAARRALGDGEPHHHVRAAPRQYPAARQQPGDGPGRRGPGRSRPRTASRTCASPYG